MIHNKIKQIGNTKFQKLKIFKIDILEIGKNSGTKIIPINTPFRPISFILLIQIKSKNIIIIV